MLEAPWIDQGIIPVMEKLRAAVIGVGYLGRFHAQKYATFPECTLVAVVDQLPEVAARVAAEVGVRAVGDYRQLLGQVDAVSIVTPTPLHYEIAQAFLDGGAHVLVEKPITETVAQAQQLIALAQQRQRVLQVGHLERFNPVIVAAEPILRAPRFIECQRLAPFRERGTDVNVVLDLMIHDLDIVQSIVGSELVAVDAIGTPVFSGEIDIANARIRFANGCVANATASRVSLKTERKLRIFQDDAYLSLDLQQKILTVIRKQAEPQGEARLPVSIEEQSFEQGDALRSEIAAFVASCTRQAPVVVSGEDGMRALRTAVAISNAVNRAPS
jgi:predicted dehydrogenase